MLLLVDSVTLHMFTGVFALGFVVFLFKYAYILQVLSSVDDFFFFSVKELYRMCLCY